MEVNEFFDMILDMLKPEAKDMLIEKIEQATKNLVLLGEPMPDAKDMIDEVRSHFPDGNIWRIDELLNTTPETDRKHVTLLVDGKSSENMMMYVDGHVISLN